MRSHNETVLSGADVERWNSDADFQRKVLFHAYTRSLMDAGTTVWILAPNQVVLAVVAAGPIEVQQAELIRQAKEKDADVARLKAVIDGLDCTHREGGSVRHCRTERLCATCLRDSRIRALADVLDSVRRGFAPAARPGGVFGLMGQNIMDEVDSALRLVGRVS